MVLAAAITPPASKASALQRRRQYFPPYLFACTPLPAMLTLTPAFSSLLHTSRRQILYFTARTWPET